MIPKIIHHVWPGDDPFKEKFFEFRKSWMHFHPDFTFCFWRLDNLPPYTRKKFYNIPNIDRYNHTVKSDILRFLIMYELGGIYVDTDLECLKSIDEFLRYEYFAGEENDQWIGPSLIGCTPKNEISKHVINESLNSMASVSIQLCNERPNIYSGTRPFTRVLRKNSDKVKIFDPSYFYPINWTKRDQLHQECPGAYTKHYWNSFSPDGWVTNKGWTSSSLIAEVKRDKDL